MGVCTCRVIGRCLGRELGTIGVVIAMMRN